MIQKMVEAGGVEPQGETLQIVPWHRPITAPIKSGPDVTVWAVSIFRTRITVWIQTLGRSGVEGLTKKGCVIHAIPNTNNNAGERAKYFLVSLLT